MQHKHIAFGLLGVLIGAMLASAAYARWPDAHSALLGNVGWLPFLVAVATLIFLGVNSRIAQRNLENTALTLDQARRAEIATRFQKGLELLQSGNVATRVGGIAVLRDVALEAPEQYWRSISAVLVNLVEAQSEILCNTIEEAFKGASQRGPTEEPVYAPAFDRTGRDVVLAVETLGLKDADLRLALERSDAIGPVALRRVALSTVTLHGLDMRHISFTESYFCRVRFSGCNFDNVSMFFSAIGTDFVYCSLAMAQIQTRVTNWWDNGLDLMRCNLTNARVTVYGRADVSMRQCDVTGGEIRSIYLELNGCWYFGAPADITSPGRAATKHKIDLGPADGLEPIETTRGFPIFRPPLPVSDDDIPF